MLFVRWTQFAAVFAACALWSVSISAARHEFDSWRDVVDAKSVRDAEIEAILGYATYLATEPEDFPSAEQALAEGLRQFPYSRDVLDAIRLSWDAQRLSPEEKSARVISLLAPIAAHAPDAESLILLVARVERNKGHSKKARRRIERCARYAGWNSPFLVREWLACLDPERDARIGKAKIASLAKNPTLHGNWIFERFAADFFNDLAQLEPRLWKKRRLQQEAWKHTLLALEDLNRQATPRTAWPLANRLVSFGLYDEARQLLDRLTLLNRVDLKTQQLRAALHEREGNWAYALQIWKSLINHRDTIPQFYLGAARCLDMTNQSKTATTYLEKAIRLTINPKQSIPLGLTVSQRLIAEKEPKRALRALAGVPQTPAVLAARAQAYFRLGMPEQAKQAMQKILAIHQASNAEAQLNADFYHLLANLFRRTSEPDKALQLLNRASQLAPTNIAITLDHAATLAELNRTDEAIKLLNNQLNRAPENQQLQNLHLQLKNIEKPKKP